MLLLLRRTDRENKSPSDISPLLWKRRWLEREELGKGLVRLRTQRQDERGCRRFAGECKSPRALPLHKVTPDFSPAAGKCRSPAPRGTTRTDRGTCPTRIKAFHHRRHSACFYCARPRDSESTNISVIRFCRHAD